MKHWVAVAALLLIAGCSNGSNSLLDREKQALQREIQRTEFDARVAERQGLSSSTARAHQKIYQARLAALP